nr:SUN domain-containing protein 1 [Tanacetum cinerariifolium]
MSSSMSSSVSSSLSSISSSMSSIPANTTVATKLRKKSVTKRTGGDVKAKALWKTAGNRWMTRVWRVVLNGNEMGLDEIPGFAKEVLNGNKWLTREEFDKFVEEFKGWKRGEMGLDEIRVFAKGVVEKEIEKLAKGVVEKEIEKHAAKSLWMTMSLIVNNLDLVILAVWRGWCECEEAFGNVCWWE